MAISIGVQESRVAVLSKLFSRTILKRSISLYEDEDLIAPGLLLFDM